MNVREQPRMPAAAAYPGYGVVLTFLFTIHDLRIRRHWQNHIRTPEILMTHHHENEATPWFRQLWSWLVLGLLAFGVMMSAVMVITAIRNPPSLVTGDYAELGKVLVDTHRRADRAQQLGLAGRVSLEDSEVDRPQWKLELQYLPEFQPADRLLMLIQHPTDVGRDRQVVLLESSPGIYQAGAEHWPSRGRIIVSDLEQSWWISARYDSDRGGLEATLKPERL